MTKFSLNILTQVRTHAVERQIYNKTKRYREKKMFSQF